MCACVFLCVCVCVMIDEQTIGIRIAFKLIFGVLNIIA